MVNNLENDPECDSQCEFRDYARYRKIYQQFYGHSKPRFCVFCFKVLCFVLTQSHFGR